MGGSGSRLSKELLAEYQVRGTPGPRELACGPLLGSRVRELAAGRPRPPQRSANPRSGFAFQDLTFLTKQEILLAHRRFCELLPQEQRSVESSLRAQVPFEQILSLPELKANPFKERICRVFSTSPAKDSLSFEDFLDLLSVFSDTATPDIKSHYAFRIFDFDDDGTLNREDLSRLVNCLTGEGEDTRLSASEMKQLIDNILEESDIDRDGTINLSEFQHVISRSPDFASSFKIVL
uniref:Calcium and integrin-binding protein 1 n=1 Tax=Gorilla gorilla gorilla TaxID=9595 RepID=A0A2I2Z4F1_GORGO